MPTCDVRHTGTAGMLARWKTSAWLAIQCCVRTHLYWEVNQMRLFGALAVAAFLLVQPSLAHDSWISNDGLKNPATEEWCCGRGDCGIVMPTPKVTAVGWVIHGDVIIDISGRRIRVRRSHSLQRGSALARWLLLAMPYSREQELRCARARGLCRRQAPMLFRPAAGIVKKDRHQAALRGGVPQA